MPPILTLSPYRQDYGDTELDSANATTRGSRGTLPADPDPDHRGNTDVPLGLFLCPFRYRQGNVKLDLLYFAFGSVPWTAVPWIDVCPPAIVMLLRRLYTLDDLPQGFGNESF